MEKHEIIRAVDSIKKGTFVRIVYQTKLPLTASAKKDGHEVVKYTEKVVRLGVKYANISKVKEREVVTTTTSKERTPWCHWEIENILAKHTTKDDYYLSFATVEGNGHHTKNTYFVDGRSCNIEEVMKSSFILPSYFKNYGDTPVVQNVNIKNIIQIGNNSFYAE